MSKQPSCRGRRVLVVGATGYIGRHVVRELAARGHDVVALARAPAAIPGAEVRVASVTSRASIEREGIRAERFDAVVSCLASRTGLPDDARLVDQTANELVLDAARDAGVEHFVLVSAICVQRPLLEFQRAKLSFEATLARSGVTWTVVRPTAFFKSLAGQVERVKRGKPFVVFEDGTLTACKPISERDLASFVADCLDDTSKQNVVLPIGGPGPAITPRDQANMLFGLLGRPPRLRRVPLSWMDAVVAGLGMGGRLVPSLARAGELARIGRFYGTESMLVLDPTTGSYSAEATPSYGTDTLHDFYARALQHGLADQELGAHAVFDRAAPRS